MGPSDSRKRLQGQVFMMWKENKQVPCQKPSTPRALIVILEDDLVDTCSPGDDVCITLTVQWRWYKAAREQRVELEMVGRAISVQLLNKHSTALQNMWEEDVAAFSAFWRFHNSARTETHSDGERPYENKVSRPLVGRDAIRSKYLSSTLWPRKGEARITAHTTRWNSSNNPRQRYLDTWR